MGVAGSGKTSVGVALAPKVGAKYVDGDDLHPRANIDKMAKSIPLNDDDRAPWLDLVGARLRATSGPVLIGCSALKRHYRDRIRSAAKLPVLFLHLAGARDVIAERMTTRKGHFMPASLLDSQFAALEPLEPDEIGFLIDIDQRLDQIVDTCAHWLRRAPEWADR